MSASPEWSDTLLDSLLLVARPRPVLPKATAMGFHWAASNLQIGVLPLFQPLFLCDTSKADLTHTAQPES